MNIRLIAFDLDGTLLDDRKNLPPEVAKRTERLFEDGLRPRA